MNGSQILRATIDGSGYKISFIAKEIGLTYQGFVNKINDISRFRANEITKLCELLKIDNETRESIFFTNYVDCTSTNE